jgi:hypothetical protein
MPRRVFSHAQAEVSNMIILPQHSILFFSLLHVLHNAIMKTCSFPKI